MKLRPYQSTIKSDIYDAWDNGCVNVMAVLPTGAGKTVTFSDVIRDHHGASCAVAHRQELVSQISLALARDGVRHRIIGPKSVIKLCANLHMTELGVSYYDRSAKCAVAGVNTLMCRRDDSELRVWMNSVTLWVTDECHHLLRENCWGKAAAMFPNAKGLGVTATPLRADGKGLGRHTDGMFDIMIEGPSMRDLINMGYLTEYRVFAPPSDLDLGGVSMSATTGDYNPQKLKMAVRKSHVVGDVVAHYMKIARGKLGVTFATDVETATDIAEQFNESGVPAAVVSAKTSDAERIAVIRRFKNRELLQLVNVDLFGEGFDLPAIEVVSMARPTQSYALYVQQFGRALRILHGKEYAIVIDHVGNVGRHGLPDAKRTWSLERREKRGKKGPTDVIPVTSCVECAAAYERIHKACPFCGHINMPAGRSGPEQVDGDLIELDAEALARMRGDIERVDMPSEVYRAELQAKYVPQIGQHAHVKRHVERQEAQTALRHSIAWWGGYHRAAGREDSEIYKRFYFAFGVDMMTAQALKAVDALALAERINGHLGDMV